MCGIQTFLFDQIGLLDDWNCFWNEIPGKMFRKDSTPDNVRIKGLIDMEGLDSWGGSLLAERLNTFVHEGGNIEKLERRLSEMYQQ